MTRVFGDQYRRIEKWPSFLIGVARSWPWAFNLRIFKLQKCFALRTTLFVETLNSFHRKKMGTFILMLASC